MHQQGKPSRIAPVLGVAGFVLSLMTLGWQVHVYKQGLEEKALVRLSVSFQLHQRDFPLGEDESFPRKEKGELSAEVVNIGQHPLYVKSVTLFAPCPGTVGEPYESLAFTPIGGFQPGAPIEPGAAVTYQGGSWDFTKHPLDFGEPHETYCLMVESNKGTVAQRSSFSSVSMLQSVLKENRSKKAKEKSPVGDRVHSRLKN